MYSSKCSTKDGIVYEEEKKKVNEIKKGKLLQAVEVAGRDAMEEMVSDGKRRKKEVKKRKN